MTMSPPYLHAPSAGFADPLYARIADLIYREAGIVLGPEKRGMMDSRLHRRIAANNCTSLADYVQRLDNGALAGERDHLVSALTTNFTHFFREAHHFDFLRGTVFPSTPGDPRALRIWSAGCSSGQEPYSIAIAAREAGRRATIVATDIDHAILERARSARYRDGELTGIPPQSRQQFFAPEGDEWVLRQPVRDMVRFEHMNLHGAWTFDGPFDVIFCRNVIIYFDAAAQLRLWDKFCRQLRPGGWLLIGHSERIPDHLRTRLRPVGHTVYQYDPGRGET
ncbi:hypothetical protein IX54_12605 [Paracoccus sanguinis]|nr:hypothetical protein IX54_12605 [Paracoccus sanguinis]